MNTEKWNPGHSTNKGYPYNNVPSREMYKNRVVVGVDAQNKPIITWDNEHFPDAPDFLEEDSNNTRIHFLLCRLLDSHEALKIAEDQVDSLLEEKPFLPEHFGFELVHRHEDIADPPARIYISKYNDSVSLYRKPGEVEDPMWDPSIWILLRKMEDGTFRQDEVRILCHRIAYAFFCALQIQVEDKINMETALSEEIQENGAIDVSDNDEVMEPGYRVYTATLIEDPTVKYPFGRTLDIPKVVAASMDKAKERAKFLFEATPEFEVKEASIEDILVFENKHGD